MTKHFFIYTQDVRQLVCYRKLEIMVKTIELAFVFFVLLFHRISSQNPNKHDAGNVYIDVLTRRFLDLESALWKEIEQNSFREDKTFILRKIHTEFLKFYSRPTIAAETPADKVNFFNQKLFESELFDADRSVSIVKNQLLQREVDRSLDHNVIGMVRSYNTALLDKIHHIAVERDYFAYLTEVR